MQKMRLSVCAWAVLCYCPLVFSQPSDGMLITGKFSDAAGSYFARWLVVKGGSVRTVLSTDEELLEGS